MKQKSGIYIFLSVFLGAILCVFPGSAQTYNFRNYSVEEGLTQSQVMSIFQSRNGLMWFGTNSGGVSSFDGNRFKTYTERNGLVNNVIYSMCDDQQGNIFFGTNGGLSIYNGFSFHNYSDSTQIPAKRVFKVMRDRKNMIWIATAKGVCRFDGKKFTLFRESDFLSKNTVFELYADSQNRIWFGTLNGVFVYDGKTTQHYTEKEGLDNNFVRTVIEDKDGTIWIGSIKGKGLNHYVNGKITHNTEILPNADQISYSASVADRKGNIWFASAAGAFKYDGKGYKRYYEHNGMGATTVLSIYCDREGNLWFGTSGGGVSKLSGEAFFNLSTSDSLPREYISSVFKDSKDNMWVGVQGAGVVRLNERFGIAAMLSPDLKHKMQSIAGQIVQCMAEMPDGRILFGTNNGLSVYDGKTFLNYSTSDGLPDLKIYSISTKPDGTILIGTRNGVCVHTGEIKAPGKEAFATPFLRLNSLLGKEAHGVFCILTDHKGNTWFGTEQGAMCVTKSEVTVYSKKNGFCDKKVSSIVEDANGQIWLGTDDGLFLYDGVSFFRADENNGLSSNKIYLVVFDNNGYLWIGTNKGLDRFNASKYSKSKTIEVKHYGKEEGFKGVECNLNACCKDKEGRIWFGTIKGVTVYDHRLDALNEVEPYTTVSNIRLFFQDADFSPFSKGLDSLTHLPSQLVLPYNKNHLTFDFQGVSLAIPARVRYAFKLEGIDGDWVPPTSKNEATYSSLPSGEYTFLLRASNNDGLWNKAPFEFHFVILPPWYKTWWFYTLCIILIVSGVYLFITIRTRQLISTQVRLESQVRERTHELREEKEKVEVINKEITAQKSIIETKNRDITDSIRYAKNIQEAILPQLDAIAQEFPQSFVLYMPKDIVSGDFYWFAKRKNKRFIATADCTGHGVPGAFMSIIGNTLLNEIVTEKEIMEPGEILNELHAGIKNALRQSNADGERRDGMDIALCSLEGDSNILEYAGANRPLWIFREGRGDRMEVVKPNKSPIGGLETEDKRRFTNNRIELRKGDLIYLSTDGYADQFGGHAGKKMMVKNFQKLLTEILHLPLPEQKEVLRKHFIEWKGDQDQVDDVLVIGFRFE
ncbi:MAG TPA: two-component regulator propeller domain-containing protein [Bacteroidia bacterium]|nr:two-component regulator propeller domain-containing protein [Bacteroidia bacterium]